MSLVDEVVDKLAIDVLKAADAMNDDALVDEIANVLGASSPSSEEAFRTAARIRAAETRARKTLMAKLKAYQKRAEASAADAAGSAPKG